MRNHSRKTDRFESDWGALADMGGPIWVIGELLSSAEQPTFLVNLSLVNGAFCHALLPLCSKLRKKHVAFKIDKHVQFKAEMLELCHKLLFTDNAIIFQGDDWLEVQKGVRLQGFARSRKRFTPAIVSSAFPSTLHCCCCRTAKSKASSSVSM
jgi:hypothetical protein